MKIFIWDHNKERAIEHIDEFMSDPEAAKEVGGFAYHWYSGDHFEALSMLRGKYPDKVLMHSESCGLHIPGKVTMLDMTDEQIEALPDGDYKTMVQTTTPNEMDFNDATAYAHDIIGDLNHGMQRWIDWNMIVDRQGGPRHHPRGFRRADRRRRRRTVYADHQLPVYSRDCTGHQTECGGSRHKHVFA